MHHDVPLDGAVCRHLPLLRPVLRKPVGGGFEELLESLDVGWPERLNPWAAVRLGWIRPTWAISLDPRFKRLWRRASSEVWKMHMTGAAASSRQILAVALNPRRALERAIHGSKSPLYWHPLDSLSADEGRLARSLQTRGYDPRPALAKQCEDSGTQSTRRALPQIAFVPYWEAYRYLEYLANWTVRRTLILRDALRPQLRETAHQLHGRSSIAASQSQKIDKRWKELEKRFLWLSCYRTAISIGAHSSFWVRRYRTPSHKSIAQETLRGLQLDTADLVEFVSHGLIPLARRFLPRDRVPPFPRVAELIRQDVSISVQAIELLVSRPAELYVRDWMGQVGAGDRLRELLGWEEARAQYDLVARIPLYLGDAPACLPSSFRHTQEEIEERVRRGWRRSISFRRFVLSLHRLHEHALGQINQGSLVGEAVATPIAYLTACVLEVEQFLQERVGPRDASMRKLLTLSLKRAVKRISPREVDAASQEFSGWLKAQEELRKRAPLTPLAERLVDIESLSVQHPGVRFALKAHMNTYSARNTLVHLAASQGEEELMSVSATVVEGLLLTVLLAVARMRRLKR